MTIAMRPPPAALLAALLAASPAMAGDGLGGGAPARHPAHAHAPVRASRATPVPEPADAVLFGLGVAGVAIGRRFRRRGA